MKYTTRPLSIEARTRLKGVIPTRSRFDSTWTSTLDLLERELTLLVGLKNGYTYWTEHEYVLQIDVEERDLRRDGELRANARPATPAVAISIDSEKSGPLLFVCGEYVDWHDNVRAIAKTLEALRAIDRYGVTKANEQYRGFGALPPGTPMPAAKMSWEDAADLLGEHGSDHGWLQRPTIGDIRRQPEWIDKLYRTAAKRHHPDAGGDPELFRRLTEARDIVTAHLGVPT